MEDKPKHPGSENLVPLPKRPVEEQRAIRSMGGHASVAVRREKKLMSRILSDYLQKEHEVKLRDNAGAVIETRTLSADKLIEETVSAILARGDSSSASIIKTVGELTEGNKLRIGGLNSDAIPFEFVDPVSSDESPEQV
jgi:hypothetical protein